MHLLLHPPQYEPWNLPCGLLCIKPPYAPMIYTALCIMFWMRALSITWASGRGLFLYYLHYTSCIPTVWPSVVDSHHLDAGPDSTYHPGADPDPDPNFQTKAQTSGKKCSNRLIFHTFWIAAWKIDADPDPDFNLMRNRIFIWCGCGSRLPKWCGSGSGSTTLD